MPKLIVLAFGADASSVSLAQAAAEGARDVRFMEVEVRAVRNSRGVHDSRSDSDNDRATAGDSGLRMFDGAEHITDYDGAMFCAGDDAASSAALDAFLEQLAALQPANRFANSVFALTGHAAPQIAPLAALGGIIVSMPRGNDDERPRAHGARTAKVIGWVRHALGHEQTDSAHHHHH